MRQLLNTITLVVLFSLYNIAYAAPVCTIYSGAWHVPSGGALYGIDKFYITGLGGSFLADSGLVGIANPSPLYANRTTMPPVTLQQGGSFSASARWGLATYRQELQVWIDFNDDGIFQLTDEVSPVSGFHTTATPNPANFMITIPASANPGLHIMRIRGIQEASGSGGSSAPAHLDPCLVRYLTTNPSYQRGDVIDYMVSIVPSGTCSGSPVAGTAIAPAHICGSNSFYLTLSGLSAAGGLTYQWQSSPDSSAWTNIAGATAVSYYRSQAATTFYRCRVTCTTSGLTSSSAGVKVISNYGGTITGPSTVCAGSLITLSVSGNTTGGSWSSSSFFIATVSPATGVAGGVSAGTIDIRYTSAPACGTIVVTHSLTVLPRPDAGLVYSTTALTTTCIGATITVASTLPGGVWAVTNNRATVDIAGVVTGMHKGIDTINYLMTNSCGTDTSRLAVTVDSSLGSGGPITAPTILCLNGLYPVSSAIAGGTWSSTSGNVLFHFFTNEYSGYFVGLDTLLYTLTNGCGPFSTRQPVTVLALPDANAIVGPTSVCAGSTIALSNTADPTGIWQSGSVARATVSPLGVVTGVSAGYVNISYIISHYCGTPIGHASILVEDVAPITAITGQSLTCIGNTITLANATPGGSWSSSGVYATVSSSGDVTGIASGIEVVTYSISNQCGPAYKLKSVMVSNCEASVEEIQATPDINIYPDPASSTLNISSKDLFYGKACDITIANVLGKVVYGYHKNMDNTTILSLDISAIPTGIYFLRIVNEHTHEYISRKIAVTR